MRKWMVSMTLLAVASVAMCGCGDDEASSTAGSKPASAQSANGSGVLPLTTVVYCGSCGHKGDEPHLCDEDHARCDKCGLHEGSELCCKVDAEFVKTFANTLMCGKCGHPLASENCCQPSIAQCEKCGLQKGSPLCCKLGDE